ncbi:MAG TPA: hypothetical protein VIQ75_05340 [Gammaproteobacteria bacterium]
MSGDFTPDEATRCRVKGAECQVSVGLAPGGHLVENGALGDSGGYVFPGFFPRETGSEVCIPEDRQPRALPPGFTSLQAESKRKNSARRNGARHPDGSGPRVSGFNIHIAGEINALA